MLPAVLDATCAPISRLRLLESESGARRDTAHVDRGGYKGGRDTLHPGHHWALGTGKRRTELGSWVILPCVL
jgi:hypothetical protein